MVAHRKQDGFTLIEMVIVVAIIALLAAMIIGGAAAIDNQGKQRAVENLFGQIEAALDAYCEFTDGFPLSPDATPPQRCERLYSDLSKVVSAREVLGQINGSLIADRYTDAVPVGPEIYDPWGTVLDYQYTAGMQYPRLISAGPDKMFGTSDDIRNK